MFDGRLLQEEDPEVDQVLEQTQSGNLRWQNKEFTENGGTDWKISFSADDGQRELVLEKESFLEKGGWVITVLSLLKIKDKNTSQESTHIFYERRAYAECLNVSGYPGVSSLTSFVIDQFRPTMNLHWVIM